MTGPIRARWLVLLWAIVISMTLAAMWRGADAPTVESTRQNLETPPDSQSTRSEVSTTPREAPEEMLAAPRREEPSGASSETASQTATESESTPDSSDSSLSLEIRPMSRGATNPSLTQKATLPGPELPAPSTDPSAKRSVSASQPPDPQPFSAARVDEILESMDWGNLAFNTPSEMTLEDPTYVHLLLDVTKSIEELKARIPGADAKEGATVRISAAMEARLTGTAFQINSITHERQAVSASQVTEWKWEVRPTDTGKQYLYLSLTAILDVNGSFTPRTIETFERTIEVRVTGWRRFTRMFLRNWEWLWTLVIVPLSAVAWYLWNRHVTSGAKEHRKIGF